MPKRKLDPLPSTAFQILLSLAEEDLHGACYQSQRGDQNFSAQVNDGVGAKLPHCIESP